MGLDFSFISSSHLLLEPLQLVHSGSPEARNSISVVDAGQPSSIENRGVSGGMDLKGQPIYHSVSHIVSTQ